MSEKRYAIVRVDGRCPREAEMEWEIKCVPNLNCSECKVRKNYGDIKEQLARKIVQVLLRRFKRMYKGKFITVKVAEKQYLEIAKEIVEFLGVEE